MDISKLFVRHKRYWTTLAAVLLIAGRGYAALEETSFSRKMDIVAANYAGTEVLANFPALIRLPAEFAECAVSSDGSDLRFVDKNKNLLPHEIDSWNPDGTSLVWVSVPSLSAETTITAYIGAETPGDEAEDSLWTGFAGVYHLNETDAGAVTIADATGNTTASAHAKSLVMDGVIGSARGRTDAFGQNGNMMTADACDALNVTPSFTVSGWLYPTAVPTWSYVFARKNADSYKSWGWQFRSKTALTPVGIYSCGTSDVAEQRNIFSVSAFAVNTWTKYDVVWNDTSVSLYLNGSLIETQTIIPSGTALDGSLAFTVGGLSGSGYGTLKAYHDEVRIATTPLSADWVAADYAQVANSDWYTYGDVMPVDDSAIVFADEPIVTEHDGQLILSVSLAEDSGSGSLSAIYGDALPFAATNQFENAAIAGQTYSTALTELTDDTSYRYGVIGENDKGTITRKFSSQAFYNGTPQLTAGEDADEVNLKTPGTIVVSRSDSIGDLTVNYTVGGTAVADVNYVALSGTVVIPDGQTSANIEVYPLRVKDGDHTVVVTLAAGAYLLGATAPSAEIAVKELQSPEGWNTWVAAEAGNASDADNWSDGVPKSGDKVLFASCFSNADCRWDVVHADGKAVLAAWTQSGDDNAYTGTIVFETTYPDADGALKTVEITGDVDLQSGTWTHPANGANEEYRLSVAVGGAFTLGADATLSAAQKGYGTGKWPSGSAAGSHAASGSGRQYVYGNVYRPSNCGAGSSDGAGGGAIWLEVGGAAQLDGLVDVRGYSADNKSQAASGSFYLKAASCAGAGKIYANVAIASCYSGSYGSGGRVGIELTGAETLDFPVANISIAGTNSGGSGGGGGTLWVGTADPAKPNGTLYLQDSRNKNYGARWQKRTAVAAIPAGETWTFDDVRIENYGMLTVPEGTTLVLKNGPQSVTAGSSFLGGIVADGGTIDFGPGPWTFSNSWIFHPNAEYVFDGDVTIAKGGAIGCLIFQGTVSENMACRLKVNGDLTIESGGYLLGNGRGPDENNNRNTANVGHGGQNGRNTASLAYGSVFNPALAGMSLATGDQATSAPGGGSLQIIVAGTLTNDGVIGADGTVRSGVEGAPGGSINIAAGDLIGTGSISARSKTASYWQSNDEAYVSTGGGRIAVRLTNGTIGTEGIWANINAAGTTFSKTGNNYTYASSSAGTIYLQGADTPEKAGTIFVASDNNANNPTYTALPSLTKTEETAADYTKATLAIAKCGRVRLFENLVMDRLTIETDSLLDLNGRTMKVRFASIGGEKLSPGVYDASSALTALLDSSEEATGMLQVTGSPLFLIIR